MTLIPVVDLPLQPDDCAPRAARRAVRQLERIGADGPLVELITSELVTNAVLHAGTPLRLRVLAGDDLVRIEVSDEAPELVAVTQEASPENGHGRGLALVVAFAERWGMDREASRKTVWAEVPVGAS